jgi:hypothetical protein
MNETTSHLLTECNCTEATWNLVADKFNLPGYANLTLLGNPVGWVRQITRTGSRKERKQKLGILITFWWMIWKERNKRIFEVACFIQETVNFHHFGWASPADC